MNTCTLYGVSIETSCHAGMVCKVYSSASVHNVLFQHRIGSLIKLLSNTATPLPSCIAESCSENYCAERERLAAFHSWHLVLEIVIPLLVIGGIAVCCFWRKKCSKCCRRGTPVRSSEYELGRLDANRQGTSPGSTREPVPPPANP